MERKEDDVYKVEKNVRCVKCLSKGAVQYYGRYYPRGIGDTASGSYEKYKDTAYLSPAMGYGGTIPYECLNCGTIGLIDFGGLEGYEMAFQRFEEEEKPPQQGGSGLQMF